MVCGTALQGAHVMGPYRAELKLPLEVVVMIRKVSINEK